MTGTRRHLHALPSPPPGGVAAGVWGFAAPVLPTPSPTPLSVTGSPEEDAWVGVWGFVQIGVRQP